MSVMVVKIRKKENTALLKKIVAALNEEASVVSDERYRDAMFSTLLEQGRQSKLLSTAQAKKELQKRGINV